jgi:L-2-hydroxyglutarate oxidase LhgO
MDLYWLEAGAASCLEPQLSCVAALCSPSTGIIDSHSYMLALLAEAEAAGALIACGVSVASLRPTPAGIEISTADETEPVVRARLVVNSTGLHATALAASIVEFPAAFIPRLTLAKGSYFALTGRSPFQRLIYPVPEPGGLGIHLTLDLAGQARFGPDVEWVDHIDYEVDPGRSQRFYPAIRRYWPQLQDGQLQPAYAGVRPKLSGPGEPAADFRISGPKEHGVSGLINLFGIESPGLTASLAVAERVAALAQTLP